MLLGRVKNWEGVEHIWSFALIRCSEDQRGCSLLVSEFLLSVLEDHQKTLEVSPLQGEQLVLGAGCDCCCLDTAFQVSFIAFLGTQ